jgi:hypothetical protein
MTSDGRAAASFRLAPIHDLYLHDGAAAVYFADRVVVLSPIATALVLLIREGFTGREVLERKVAERYGAPPGVTVAAAVSQHLDALRATGLVQPDI